jgi:hypothetical protein
VRRTERQHDLVWGAMGLGMGLLAGFVLAEAVGAVDRARVSRAVRRLGADPALAPLPSAQVARAASMALAGELGLADLTLETRALGAGRVELLGWVPDRRRRALAERTVASLSGITGVVNRILVEQEDPDAPVEDHLGYADLTFADQSA